LPVRTLCRPMAEGRLGIDVDGVLANTVPSVLERLEDEYGHHGDTKEDVTEWGHTVEVDGKSIPLGSEIVEGHMVEEHLRSINPKQGAKESVETLRGEGYEVVIVTNRPSDRDTVRWTKSWLEENGLGYDRFHSTAETTKTAVDVDVLIDDHDRNVVEFLEDGRPAVLFDQPWNTVPDVDGAGDRMEVVTGWEEAVETVQRLV
jgi:5'(3')-deoxyribonucleotidase